MNKFKGDTIIRWAKRYHISEGVFISIGNTIDCPEDTFSFYLRKAESLVMIVDLLTYTNNEFILSSIPLVALGIWKQQHDIENETPG